MIWYAYYCMLFSTRVRVRVRFSVAHGGNRQPQYTLHGIRKPDMCAATWRDKAGRDGRPSRKPVLRSCADQQTADLVYGAEWTRHLPSAQTI